MSGVSPRWLTAANETLKAVDLGMVSIRDAAIHGIRRPLIPFAEGRAITGIRFLPGATPATGDIGNLYFVTPNTFPNTGFALVPHDDLGNSNDTLGIIVTGGQTSLSGGTSGSSQILDVCPLSAVIYNQGDGLAYYRGATSWTADTPYCLGDFIIENDAIQLVTVNGVSDSTKPVFGNPGDDTVDGTVTWHGYEIPEGEVHAVAEVIEGVSPMPPYPTSLEWLDQPTDTEAGDIMATVRVAIKDQYGNYATFGPNGLNVDIFGAGTLNGTKNGYVGTGILTLSDLSITEPGTGYILRANMIYPNVDPIFSDPFDITALVPKTPISLWAADSLGYNDGDDVTAWSDDIASKTLAPDGVTPPKFKTNIVNALPVVRFANTSSRLKYAAFNNTNPSTFIIVAKQTDKDSGGGGILVAGEQKIVLKSATGYFSADAGTEVVFDSMDRSGAFHVFTVIFHGGGAQGFVDGILAGSGAVGSGAITDIYVGGFTDDHILVGDIAEVWVFDSALSTFQREFREDALATKYGL